ncbi:GNAT family N-acetyltransferase [Brevibacillus sp. SYSU BS000544]|uniref:GNAT family N-acetyltransferase n=1 Tax=Brevibacillus sp. SYSU BS000544 TaxID=3416443 RepID=UPI003CE48A60
MPGAWFQYTVALKNTGQLIGDCAVHTLQSESDIVEIGFTFAPEHHRRAFIAKLSV